MSVRNQGSTSLLGTSSALRELWRLPSMTVARFTLVSYIRSGWILGDFVFVWLLYAIFFLEFGGDVAYFYGTAGQGLDVLAVLSTVVMVQRAMHARVYLPLSRMTSRSAYVRGLVIATAVLRVLSFLMLLGLAMLHHNFSPPSCTIGNCIQGATFSNMLPGALGLLVNCMVISTLVVVFSAPIATRRARILLFVWFAAVLYSNTSPGPVAAILGIVRLPLLPLAICYGFGTTQSIDWSGIAALMMSAVYVVGLTLLGEYWLKRRDLILQ